MQRKNKIVFILLSIVALNSTSGKSQTSDSTNTRSLLDGVFNGEQVSRGALAFENQCARCHQPAQFSGPGFLPAWSGQTVDKLYSHIRTTMPFDNPGRLTRKACVDILAFIFDLNGLPAGEAELPRSLRKLKAIQIRTLPESETRSQ